MTIVLCLAFGIACGYAVITAILRSLGHKPAAAPPATAVIATTASSR